MKLRCLTLYQPHASAVALGLKQIETRVRNTWVRGQIGIHAGMIRTDGMAQFFNRLMETNDAISHTFKDAGFRSFDSLPFGQIIALAEIEDSIRADMISPLSVEELLLGNFERSRHGWILKNVKRLARPIPVRGRQGFFFVDVTKRQLQLAA